MESSLLFFLLKIINLFDKILVFRKMKFKGRSGGRIIARDREEEYYKPHEASVICFKYIL